jgi:UDP-N-acetylglucosamine acyltransferase
LVGLNLTGLKRRGFSREAMSGLKKAYRLVFRSGLKFEEAVSQVEQECGAIEEVKHLMDFLGSSQRGFARSGG